LTEKGKGCFRMQLKDGVVVKKKKKVGLKLVKVKVD
jgi:hypothetical protein